jgi:membrane associated rhomboid family serine protease
MNALIPIRDENPYHRTPFVTVALIAVNVFVLFSVGVSEQVFYRLGAIPCVVLDRCPRLSDAVEAQFGQRPGLVSVLTSMFVHADLLHLGFNMLFLWVFGNNVEDRLGHVRFTVFYLVTGFAASFAHIAFNPLSEIPTVGASGAISGVLGAYIVLFPHATVVSLLPLGIFFWPIRTPAWVSLGLWFVGQFLGGLVGLGRVQQGGVAFLAHIGGFVAGLLLIVPFGGRRARVGSPDRGRF